MDEMTPSTREYVETIRSTISSADIYDQLAEEASELAHAANKMARVLRGTNPTPKNEWEAYKDVVEEYTDLINVAKNVLDIRPDVLIGRYKLYRWAKRIEQKEGLQ